MDQALRPSVLVMPSPRRQRSRRGWRDLCGGMAIPVALKATLYPQRGGARCRQVDETTGRKQVFCSGVSWTLLQPSGHPPASSGPIYDPQGGTRMARMGPARRRMGPASFPGGFLHETAGDV